VLCGDVLCCVVMCCVVLICCVCVEMCCVLFWCFVVRCDAMICLLRNGSCLFRVICLCTGILLLGDSGLEAFPLEACDLPLKEIHLQGNQITEVGCIVQTRICTGENGDASPFFLR